MSKDVPAGGIDPLKAWREWFVKSERDWSEALTRVMKDDTVARSVGQEINAGLYAQQMMTQGMAGPLAMLNLPTQEQITALGERIGRLEDAVARVEAGLLQLGNALGTRDVAPPHRTRTVAGALPAPPHTNSQPVASARPRTGSRTPASTPPSGSAATRAEASESKRASPRRRAR